MSANKKVGPRRGFRATFNSPKRQAADFLEGYSADMNTLSRRIWETPELGLEEYRSSAVLIEELEKFGFRVETGVAGMPTSFVGRWGKGRPHIGIIAEYDAVPNAGPKETDNGHGCGHNLFGTASTSAGVAVKEVLKKSGAQGSIIVFGTPAEEILLGKVKMVKAGVFDGLDAVLSWHPWEATLADYTSCMALDSLTFEFFGQSAHAQIDPEMARSALGALELMNEGVNRLRGQVPKGTGFHYVIPEAGKYPGVILPYAKSWYWLWTPSRGDLPPLTRPRATLDTGPFAVHSGEPAPGLGFLGIWPLVRVAGRPRHCEAVAGCTPASTSPPAPGPLSGSRSSPRSGAHPSASR